MQPGKKGGGLGRLQKHEIPGCLQLALQTLLAPAIKGSKGPWRTMEGACLKGGMA